MKLKEIENLIINKRHAPEYSGDKLYFNVSGFNEALTQQGEKSIGLKYLNDKQEDALCRILEKSIMEYDKQCTEGWPTPLIKKSRWIVRALYNGIKSIQSEIIESVKE